MSELIIFTDGASRGNPGLASTGFVIKSSTTTLHEGGSFLGIATNNVAEYSAIVEALSKAKDFTVNSKETSISFYMDSKLAVEQLSGRYKIKNATLRELVIQVKILEAEFKFISYQHVPREKNQEADAMANKVLDQ